MSSFLERFQSKLESLYTLPEDSRYVVAYSGGVDSHVLLYCCAKLGLPVRAVHVHHGLQDIADEWVGHCQNICEHLAIKLDVVYVDAQQKDGESPEESARNARYHALHLNLQKGDCLITAQHQNDQAETLLLQLFRTAGTAGLAAMPEIKRSAEYVHVRPLLSFGRHDVETFAHDNKLRWIEDPSNQDISFDRNYLRRNMLPELQTRWPNLVAQLSNVAKMQSSNLRVLEDMAAIDLANTVIGRARGTALSGYETVSVLSLVSLRLLSNERIGNLLRYWISDQLKVAATRNLIMEIIKAVIFAQQDASPVVFYSGYEFRKHQNSLYLVKGKPGLNDLKEYIWNPSLPLQLPELQSQISAARRIGEGLKLELLDMDLQIRFRKGGEHFHPQLRSHSQSLKKLLQEAGIPSWERNTLPLLYYGDDCIAVVGVWFAKEYAVEEGGDGWIINVEKL